VGSIGKDAKEELEDERLLEKAATVVSAGPWKTQNYRRAACSNV